MIDPFLPSMLCKQAAKTLVVLLEQEIIDNCPEFGSFTQRFKTAFKTLVQEDKEASLAELRIELKALTGSLTDARIEEIKRAFGAVDQFYGSEGLNESGDNLNQGSQAYKTIRKKLAEIAEQIELLEQYERKTVQNELIKLAKQT